jgi:hypothetical protein
LYIGETTLANTNFASVGISSSTPWGYVSISPPASANVPEFVIGSSTNATHFIVLPNGNVGIGTSSPSALFSITGGNAYIGGNLLTLHATSTSLTVRDLNAASCDVKSTTAGALYCGTDATGGGGGVSDWIKNTNYNVLNLTPSTTLPVWFKDMVYASTSLVVADQVSASRFTATSSTATSTFKGRVLISPMDVYSRGIFDVLSTTTITRPFGQEAVFTYFSGNYQAFGISYQYRIYAYKTVSGVRVYSPTYAETVLITDDNSFNTYTVGVSWDAVTGASGYRVLIYNSDAGYNFDYYYDTTSTSFTDGDGTEGFFQYGQTVTPTTLGPDFYISPLGDATTTRAFTADTLHTTSNSPNYWSGPLQITTSGSVGSSGSTLVLDNPTGVGRARFQGLYGGFGFRSSLPAADEKAWQFIASAGTPGGSGRLYLGALNDAESAETTVWYMDRNGYGALNYMTIYSSKTGLNMPYTSPPLNVLDVEGAAVIGANYGGSVTAPSNGLLIEGNVGIGTSSPYAKLSVTGETVSLYFTATSTTATSSFQRLFAQNATATAMGVLNLSAAGCDVKATTGGALYCGTDATGAGGGGASDWIQNTNYNVLTLTPSTTIPVWFKSNIFASSSAFFNGIVYVTQASTTATSSALLVNTNYQYATSSLIFDPLVSNGPISMTYEWAEAKCPYFTNLVTADTSATVPAPCSDWVFNVAGAGVTSATNLGRGLGSGMTVTAGVNRGMALAVHTVGFQMLGSTTPLIFETIMHHTTSAGANSTTTPILIMGFSNYDITSATYTYTDIGCYILASSTLANYQAVCRSAATTAATTIVDTGISTTTLAPGQTVSSQFDRAPILWRLTLTPEAFTVFATVIGDSGVRARITSNLPTGAATALHPLIKLMTGSSHTSTPVFHFFGRLNAYWKVVRFNL